MKHVFLWMVVAVLSLHAYQDSDLDGVEDRYDQCPNTALTELVDIRGCTVRSLVESGHYDIVFGVGYSELDPTGTDKVDTLSTSVQLDYYVDNLSFQLLASTYSNENDSGLNDTTVAGYYHFSPVVDLEVKVGGGVILPTYDSSLNNEAVDVMGSLNVSYRIDSVSLFGGYSYTVINDKDRQGIIYQDVNALSAGIGYSFSPRLYGSVSHYVSESVYRSIDGRAVEDIETGSVYLFYSVDEHLFVTGTYSKGLSDSASDHMVLLRAGYYF